MADIAIYIEYRNSERVMLPVNPEVLRVKAPGNNTTENVIALGDINILKRPGLQEISFESFIPKTPINAGYITAGATISPQQKYIDFFTAVRDRGEPINFVVSELGIVIEMAIQEFEYWWSGGDQDMHYTLDLKQFKSFGLQVVQPDIVKGIPLTPAPQTQAAPRANIPRTPAVGSTVVVNGRLYEDSYGNGTPTPEINATRKVSLIMPNNPYPYHLVTTSGSWRGWAAASSVEVVA
jgi:hypothetical protein